MDIVQRGTLVLVVVSVLVGVAALWTPFARFALWISLGVFAIGGTAIYLTATSWAEGRTIAEEETTHTTQQVVPSTVREVLKEREVIREVVKIRCRNCGTLAEQTSNRCPHCGAAL